jgi:hypothetical protein
LLGKKGRGESLRGSAGRVESREIAGDGIAIENKEVATEAILHGFGDGEDCVGRNRGVNRGTAAGQNLAPVCEVRTWLVATIPCRAVTIERA